MKIFSTPSILFLAAALGAGAGIVATSLTISSLHDYSAIISATGPISLSGERPLAEPGSFEQALEEIRDKVTPATIEVFTGPSDSTGAYEPGRGEASGFFVTSDGWLIVAPDNLSVYDLERSIILFGQKIYPVEKAVVDSSSSVVFLKIDVNNAPVTSFGNSLLLESGDSLFVVGYSEAILSSSLFRSIQTGSVSNQAGVVNRRLELAQEIDVVFSGSAVVNSSGEVVGILISDNTDKTSTVLPLTAIKPVIHSLLKDGEATGLWFGAVVTDLSRAIGYDSSFTRDYTRGALLGTITKDSPAESAGLQRGDIIISVGGLEINEHQSLAELLSAYHVGDSVSLVVDHEDVVSKIDLVLGAK